MNKNVIFKHINDDVVLDKYNLFVHCQHILNERNAQYGDKSFERIAKLWNIYLEDKKELSSSDVAMMMVLFKLVREWNDYKLDNIVDAINYLYLYKENL